MKSSLEGRVILVTGGTSGIGEATALALADVGAHVVLTGRREKEGEAVAERVRSRGVKGAFVQGDVVKEADQARFVSEALKLTGRLDGAFNNAGVELMGVNTVDATEAEYRRVFDINVLGVLLSMKHQLPVMLKAGKGAIVNTASIAGRIGMPGAGIYIATKHAVLGLTKTAAMEVAKQGVRVNAVSPAAIETPMLDRFTGNNDPEAVKYMTSLHPIGRLGKSEEVAKAALFLLSDDASFITGHDLLVDGGFTVP
ncbi:MAG: glucose 1-dehydrogenase [Phycisphaerales bacterium]